MRCPSCNSKIPDDSMICLECGKRIKRKYKKRYKKRRKSSNWLVVLIAFLCLLLLVGFVLVAVKLLLLDDRSGQTDSGTLLEEIGSESGDGIGELTGESIVLTENQMEDVLSGETLIENPSRGQSEAADYDLTAEAKVSMAGRMYQRGSEKELLLMEPKSFYGKDATGTKVLVSQVDTIHFASSQSKVSVQELRSVPDGAAMTCTGSLYIHDGSIFMKLESMIWEPWEDTPQEISEG